jgi:hypothetical protein
MTSRLTHLSELMERANTRSLTADDKNQIKQLSQEYNMRFRETKCNECWKDQVRLLILHTRKLIKKAENK